MELGDKVGDVDVENTSSACPVLQIDCDVILGGDDSPDAGAHEDAVDNTDQEPVAEKADVSVDKFGDGQAAVCFGDSVRGFLSVVPEPVAVLAEVVVLLQRGDAAVEERFAVGQQDTVNTLGLTVGFGQSSASVGSRSSGWCSSGTCCIQDRVTPIQSLNIWLW